MAIKRILGTGAVVTLALVGTGLLATQTWAQDQTPIEEQIAELKQNAETSAQNGVTAMQNNQYSTAATEFSYAAQYAKQLKGYALAEYLPEASDGWATENLEIASAGAAMFGGGTTVEQDYVNAESTVTIRILTDSPLMQSVAMMLNNPMIMMGANQKTETVMINNQRAMVETKSNGKATVSLPYGGVFLLQGEGPKDEVVALMNNIDFQGLSAVQ